MIILYTFAVLLCLEGLAYAFCHLIGFPSGVIVKRRLPTITPQLVRQFLDHGYDPELGWIRKPNTSKKDAGKLYCIDHRGSRCNPGHENLPLLISTYGDSYTFCRECEDHETWQWHLAEKTKRHVLNFGVGNYGFDQALLRLKREHPKNAAPIVIMGVVPETIARILSVWKHFYEHGNVLAFKPRYVLDDNRIRLIPNYIDSEEKYYRLDQFIKDVQQYIIFTPPSSKKRPSDSPIF